jgi:predicted N-acetyltransferase YhbS
MEEQAWEISEFREEDKADMVALNKAEYGDVALSTEAYFDWLNTARPKDIRYRVVREKATGRAISTGMSVALRASWRGQEIPVMLGVNIVIAPEYRRQGIHTTLTAQRREDLQNAGYRFVCVYPNQRSMPTLVRSGKHILVSQVPLLVRPLKIRVLGDRYIRNPLIRRGVGLGWRIGSHTLWRESEPSMDGTGLHIEEDTQPDEAYERFWEQVKTKYQIMLVRDRAFLQWRFVDIPIRKYQMLSARKGGEILGYIVLREADIRGTMTGLIADFLVLPGETGDQAGLRLLYEALQRFKQAELPLTGALMLPHTQEYHLMRRAGYLRTPDRLAPQPFFLFVRPYNADPPPEVLARPDAWFVSIADHDAV